MYIVALYLYNDLICCIVINYWLRTVRVEWFCLMYYLSIIIYLPSCYLRFFISFVYLCDIECFECMP